MTKSATSINGSKLDRLHRMWRPDHTALSLVRLAMCKFLKEILIMLEYRMKKREMADFFPK